jgi:hypothetical protein
MKGRTGCLVLAAASPLVLVLVLILAGGGVIAALVPSIPAGSIGTTGGLTDVPPVGHLVVVSDALLPGVPAGGYPDYFPAGQCTYWAALNHRVTWNGNADEWVGAASAQGHGISSTPAVGYVVAWGAGWPYSDVGHVAIVVAVSASSYTVSEMHYAGLGVVDLRTIAWPDPHVQGFIP